MRRSRGTKRAASPTGDREDVKRNKGSSSSYLIVTADDPSTIAELAEEAGIAYSRGCGFYMVYGNKKEKISKAKDMVAYNATTHEYVRGGDEVRAALDLGTGAIQVKASDVPDGWKLFVNSTSANRKILAGQGVLFEGDFDSGDEDEAEGGEPTPMIVSTAPAPTLPKSTPWGTTSGDAAAGSSLASTEMVPNYIDCVTDGDATIKDLCAAAGITFSRGIGFYQLRVNKKEKISAAKELVAVRGNPNSPDETITGAAEVRAALGLGDGALNINGGAIPDGWTLFVCSTSANRKIVAGQHVLLRDGDKPAPAPAAAAAAAAAADDGDESSDDGMYITDDDRKITARQEAAYAVLVPFAEASLRVQSAVVGTSASVVDIEAAHGIPAGELLVEATGDRIALADGAPLIAIPGPTSASRSLFSDTPDTHEAYAMEMYSGGLRLDLKPRAGDPALVRRYLGFPETGDVTIKAADVPRGWTLFTPAADRNAILDATARVATTAAPLGVGSAFHPAMVSDANGGCPVADVPPEVLDAVFAFVGDAGLVACAGVCQSFRAVASAALIIRRKAVAAKMWEELSEAAQVKSYWDKWAEAGLDDFAIAVRSMALDSRPDFFSDGPRAYSMFRGGYSYRAKASKFDPSTEDDIPVGANKIGGLPDLPPGVEWPAGMVFHFQLRGEDLAAKDVRGVYPTSGMTYVFSSAFDDLSVKVIHCDSPLDNLTRVSSAPKGVAAVMGPLKLDRYNNGRPWWDDSMNLVNECFGDFMPFDPVEEEEIEDGAEEWCRLFGTGSTPYWRECWCLEVYLRWEDVADWSVDRALGQWHED